MPQLFIIEGPDAAGKTTLATNLADRLNANIFRCTWKPNLGKSAALIEYFDNVLDNAEEALTRGRHMIIDRHWPSEWVYGKVMGRAATPCEELSRLDGRIKDLGGVYVFASDPVRDQVQRHQANLDPEHPYPDDKYTEICGRYFQWWFIMQKCTPVYRYQLLADGANGAAKFCHNLESDTIDRLYFPPFVHPIESYALDNSR